MGVVAVKLVGELLGGQLEPDREEQHALSNPSTVPGSPDNLGDVPQGRPYWFAALPCGSFIRCPLPSLGKLLTDETKRNARVCPYDVASGADAGYQNSRVVMACSLSDDCNGLLKRWVHFGSVADVHFQHPGKDPVIAFINTGVLTRGCSMCNFHR
jgi:hypothetical protein